MELIMLGTGSAMVTKCYNTCFALRREEEYFLVDAGGGNGILSQLEKAEIDYKRRIVKLSATLSLFFVKCF